MTTIGRLIADAGGLRAVPSRLDNRGRRKRPRPPKPRKPKDFRARRPGEVLAVDTVIAVRDGVRRYLFACLNLRSRFGLAVATPGMSSRWAREFADLAFDLFPGREDRMLSDNGSDYEGELADLLTARGIARDYTHPKTPKMNAHAERFNRTVQEEFLDYHEDLLWGGGRTPRHRTGSWWSGCFGTTGAPARGSGPVDADRRRPGALDARLRRPPSPRAAGPATPPPHRPTGRVLSSMKRCQIHWARTRT